MGLLFYPHEDDIQNETYEDRIGVLLDAAESYKAAVLEIKASQGHDPDKLMSPGQMEYAFNWPEIAAVLQEVRDLPEANERDKKKKAELLIKLAEVYEVLRGAKMSKLEAVRMGLVNEAKLLGGNTAGI